MNRFRKILSAISYVCIGGGPVLAATGVGLPIAAAIGGVGVLAGGILHFLDSPTKSSQEIMELGRQAKAAADAVKAIRK